jgi:hypothetical protein
LSIWQIEIAMSIALQNKEHKEEDVCLAHQGEALQANPL